ncbi:MAG: VTT domain-containing protein [Candidatus Odinarchaeota archaeon]
MFLTRILGIATFNTAVIEEIENNRKLNAIAAVLLVFSVTIESFIMLAHVTRSYENQGIFYLLISGTGYSIYDIGLIITAVLGYLDIVFGLIACTVLSMKLIPYVGNLLGGETSTGELLRLTGFFFPVAVALTAVTLLVPVDPPFIYYMMTVLIVIYLFMVYAYAVHRALDMGLAGAAVSVGLAISIALFSYIVLMVSIVVFLFVVSISNDFQEFLVNLVKVLGPPGLVILMALQAVIAPLPAQFFLIFAGESFREDYGNAGGIAIAIVAGTIGMQIGAWLAYYIGDKGGRPIVAKLLGTKALADAEKWFAKYGAWAVLFSRLVPFAPADPVSYVAGIGKTPIYQFSLAIFVTSVIGSVVYVIGGEVFADMMEEFPILGSILDLAIIGFLLFAAVAVARLLWVESMKRWKRLQQRPVMLPLGTTAELLTDFSSGLEVPEICQQCGKHVPKNERVNCPSCDCLFCWSHVQNWKAVKRIEARICPVCQKEVLTPFSKEVVNKSLDEHWK